MSQKDEGVLILENELIWRVQNTELKVIVKILVYCLL